MNAHHNFRILPLVAALMLVSPAIAVAKKAYVGKVVKQAGKTGGGAARDGSRSVGRSVRSFFKEGPKSAKGTWKQNASVTKTNARAGGAKTKAAAKQ